MADEEAARESLPWSHSRGMEYLARLKESREKPFDAEELGFLFASLQSSMPASQPGRRKTRSGRTYGEYPDSLLPGFLFEPQLEEQVRNAASPEEQLRLLRDYTVWITYGAPVEAPRPWLSDLAQEIEFSRQTSPEVEVAQPPSPDLELLKERIDVDNWRPEVLGPLRRRPVKQEDGTLAWSAPSPVLHHFVKTEYEEGDGICGGARGFSYATFRKDEEYFEEELQQLENIVSEIFLDEEEDLEAGEDDIWAFNIDSEAGLSVGDQLLFLQKATSSTQSKRQVPYLTQEVRRKSSAELLKESANRLSNSIAALKERRASVHDLSDRLEAEERNLSILMREKQLLEAADADTQERQTELLMEYQNYMTGNGGRNENFDEKMVATQTNIKFVEREKRKLENAIADINQRQEMVSEELAASSFLLENDCHLLHMELASALSPPF